MSETVAALSQRDTLQNNIMESNQTGYPTLTVIPFELTDEHALTLASAPRRVENYTPEYLQQNAYVPPSNTDPEYYLPDVFRDNLTIVDAKIRLYIQAHTPIPQARRSVFSLSSPEQYPEVNDMKIVIVRHTLQLPSGETMHAPIDTGIGFTYTTSKGEHMRVVGPPLISALQALPKAGTQGLPDDERMKVISYHFGQYLREMSDYDVTCIVIPKRGEGSPTQRAFVQPGFAVSDPVTGNVTREFGNNGGGNPQSAYFFAHGEGDRKEKNIAKAQLLMADPVFTGVARIADRTFFILRQIPQLSREQKQIRGSIRNTINSALIHSYRAAQK